MIPELRQPSVHMRDSQTVERLIQVMRQGGSSALQVISDFDMTLTRFSYKGKRCPTSYNILDSSQLISEDCKAKLQDLLNIYRPIETNPGLSAEQKLPLMMEWWTKAHALLVQQKIQKDQLSMAVRESGAVLREGYQLFFDCLKDQGIPLLIFSAGIGDVLEEVIRQAGVFHPNVKVFSNYMDFDESGTLQAFKDQLIHIYNKSEVALLNSAHFQELHARHNVLLLGDSLGDLTMADGVPHLDNVLKIGFLNDQVEQRREAYLQAYDIVLERDETMGVANAILIHITGGQ